MAKVIALLIIGFILGIIFLIWWVRAFEPDEE